MGLLVSVLRSPGSDCTNHGITSRHTQLCITNIPGPFEPTNRCPAAKLMPGHLEGTVRIVPEECGNDHTMFGGNYVATCDSRLGSAIVKLTGNPWYGAVAVHDRREW